MNTIGTYQVFVSKHMNITKKDAISRFVFMFPFIKIKCYESYELDELIQL